MMKKIYIITIVALAFAACNRTPETRVLDLPGLRPSEIFDVDDVAAFLDKHGDKNKKTATAYFEKGKKLEKKDPDEAIWNYKRAITLHPTSEYYHTLGELLISTKNYFDATKLYRMLVSEYNLRDEQGNKDGYLFGKPSEEDVYLDVLCQVLHYNSIWADGLYTAKELGYDFDKLRERLFKDERFPFDTASVTYKEIANMLLSDEEVDAYASKPEHFREFIGSIKDTSATYAIGTNSVADFRYKDFEYWDETGRGMESLYRGFLKQKQENADAWFSYNLKNTYRLNDSICYVIYSIDTSEPVCPKPMRHVTYTLATYTNEGKIVDAKQIAWQSGESLAEAMVSNGFADVKVYQRAWRSPYKKTDFDNQVLSSRLLKSHKLQLMPDGKIREELSGN